MRRAAPGDQPEAFPRLPPPDTVWGGMDIVSPWRRIVAEGIGATPVLDRLKRLPVAPGGRFRFEGPEMTVQRSQILPDGNRSNNPLRWNMCLYIKGPNRRPTPRGRGRRSTPRQAVAGDGCSSQSPGQEPQTRDHRSPRVMHGAAYGGHRRRARETKGMSRGAACPCGADADAKTSSHGARPLRGAGGPASRLWALRVPGGGYAVA